MRSVFRRLRLFSQAATVPRREAFPGITLLTMKASSRRPATASPTTSSAPPLAYISAVSISVIPRSMPSRSAVTSSLRRFALSPMVQVPCPSAGTVSPVGSAIRGMVLMDRRLAPRGILEITGERIKRTHVDFTIPDGDLGSVRAGTLARDDAQPDRAALGLPRAARFRLWRGPASALRSLSAQGLSGTCAHPAVLLRRRLPCRAQERISRGGRSLCEQRHHRRGCGLPDLSRGALPGFSRRRRQGPRGGSRACGRIRRRSSPYLPRGSFRGGLYLGD